MRLWSLHPSYLDTKGLVALWREALLAKAVLEGNTVGYTNHPQLVRFKKSKNPLTMINQYLYEVLRESEKRGYNFDPTKCKKIDTIEQIPVTQGQVTFEWEHLLKKLKKRDIEQYKRLVGKNPTVHSIFYVTKGEVELWEKH